MCRKFWLGEDSDKSQSNFLSGDRTKTNTHTDTQQRGCIKSLLIKRLRYENRQTNNNLGLHIQVILSQLSQSIDPTKVLFGEALAPPCTAVFISPLKIKYELVKPLFFPSSGSHAKRGLKLLNGTTKPLSRHRNTIELGNNSIWTDSHSTQLAKTTARFFEKEQQKNH